MLVLIFANVAGPSREIVKFVAWYSGISLSLLLWPSLSLAFSLSRLLSLSRHFALSLFVSSQPRLHRWGLSTRAGERENGQWRLQGPACSEHANKQDE